MLIAINSLICGLVNVKYVLTNLMFNTASDILLKVPATNSVCIATGSELHTKGKYNFSSCPECSSRMWTIKNAFLCENSLCSLRVATPLEFLAAKSYKYNIGNALDHYISIVDPRNKLPLEKNIIAEDLTLRRKVLQLVVNSSKNSLGTFEDITVSGWLRKQGISLSDLKSAAVIWNKETVSRYIGMLGSMKQPVIPDNPYFLVIPYMTSHSSLGALLFTSPEMSKPVIHYFSSKKYMWAGLLFETKPNDSYLVTSSFSNFLNLTAKNRVFITDQIPLLSVLVNKGAFDYDFCPDNVHYLFDNKTDFSSGVMTELAFDCKDFKIGSLGTCPNTGTAYTWNKFIEVFVLRNIEKYGLSGNVLSFVDSAQLSNAQELNLINKLTLSGFVVEANELRKHLSNKIIHLGDNTCVTQTSDGYKLSSGKTNKKVSPITNFTLDVIKNVAFPEQKKVLSEVIVNFKEKEFSMWLPVDGLESSSSVEESVRNGWINSAHAGDSREAIPMIMNKTDYRKFISPYTRNLASRCPYKTGVSYLGWDFKKTKYVGPGWFITQEGYFQDDNILYPDSEFMKKFISSELYADNTSIELNNGIKKCYAILLGFIARNFFDRLIKGIKIPSSENDIITSLLASLGQLDFLSPDHRSSIIENNHGFPVGVINTSEYYLNKVVAPAIEVERKFNNRLTQTIDSKHFHYVLISVIAGLINGRITDVKEVNSSSFMNSIILEGSSVIEQATGIPWNVEITSDPYDELFSAIPKVDLIKTVKLLPSKGVAVYRSSKTKSEREFPMDEFTSKAYTYYNDNGIDFEFELA